MSERRKETAAFLAAANQRESLWERLVKTVAMEQRAAEELDALKAELGVYPFCGAEFSADGCTGRN